MRHVLIIEPDAPRRRELSRHSQYFPWESLLVDNYAAGQKWLAATAHPRMDAVVLACPQPGEAGMLLDLLCQPDCTLPLVILTAETGSATTLESRLINRNRTSTLSYQALAELDITLARLAKAAPATKAAIIPEDDSPVRILLVDDSNTALYGTQRTLEAAGYDVATADGPVAALEYIEQTACDIAILDYYMPELTGAELCRKIHAHPAGQDILCAILTGGYEDEIIRASLEAGAMDCLFKTEAEALFLARIGSLARDVRMHRRMTRKQHELEGILASVGDGVYRVDRDMYITYVNPAVSRLLGYDEETLLSGTRPHTLFHSTCPEQQPDGISSCRLSRAIKSGLPLEGFEGTFRRADGTEIQVELTIHPLELNGQREGAVVAFRDISERKLLESELKWQASHDPLTKLHNRQYLERALEQEILKLQHTGNSSALLYLDLDRFKYVNDTIGHQAGDQLLVQLADELRERMRQSDLLARIGGDEFGILLRDIAPDRLFAAAEEYRKMLEGFLFHYQGRSYNLHGSIGVAVVDQDASDAGSILSAADLACHVAKTKGRNMTHVYDNEDRKSGMDLELGWTRRLRNALQNDGFELVYQPMVALADLALDNAPMDAAAFQVWLAEEAGNPDAIYECLIRMRDKRGRMIAPNAFLPTAERFNLMADIDRWVLDSALDLLAEANQANQHLQLSVNLSGQCMNRAEMLDYLTRHLTDLQLPAGRLMLEITESCAINHLESARECISTIRQLGCHFAIDDFGTGYSTLAQLKHLPADFIKIDGQFIREIESDPTDLEVVRSIVQIARASGKRTVAEYVESWQALRVLQECGVDYAQGFFLSPPRVQLPNTGARDEGRGTRKRAGIK